MKIGLSHAGFSDGRNGCVGGNKAENLVSLVGGVADRLIKTKQTLAAAVWYG